ncbi:unnamed protein product [Vitrella brassicaformis CCMP3155]|uniref:Uncharacterized protein n=1 Tax=Vitrella brassicaformis (strain CCMP3155) TaxID=1169540 RepID=A0A0G4FGH9_VITBC|nr:unnamed protein product [Vitrella brassicaformis CCMP3155]|eukprot:CEM12420.1 unnamed protein product [Vitrella brassicaformis CCMP3155]
MRACSCPARRQRRRFHPALSNTSNTPAPPVVDAIQEPPTPGLATGGVHGPGLRGTLEDNYVNVYDAHGVASTGKTAHPAQSITGTAWDPAKKR